MKKSAHEVFKKAIDKNLSVKEYENLLIKEGLIIKQSKEEIRDMFLKNIKVPDNTNELFKKSFDKISTNWAKCKHKNITRSDGLDECLDCGVKNY